jgi:FG-GAP-like repeat
MLDGDWLELRTLLAVSPLQTAVPLHFGALNDAHVMNSLSTPDEFQLYSLALQTGETFDASLDAIEAGSGLTSLLRVFNSSGTPLALDNQLGGDPQLTFQASSAGTYYIGVSSAPDNDYNPTVANSGVAGTTTGSYTLSVTVATATALMPDLTGNSFRTGSDMAAAGDTVPISFTVQNRGAADPGKFEVQVLLSQSNIFPGSSRVLATYTRAELVTDATGRDFSSQAGWSVTLPSGQPAGPAFIGLRIVADPTVPEAGLSDKSGVHRGSDWEPITIVTRVTAGATDLSQVDEGLNTEATGSAGPNQDGTYTLTVTSSMGSGELTAEVTGSGALVPRLTISGQTGQTLIQSDSGKFVQALEPGLYFLTVSAAAGAGSFRLTTSFVATSPLLAPLPNALAGGFGQARIAMGDLTNSGILDLVVPDQLADTVDVYMGNGDGTFQPPEVINVGAEPRFVTLADLTGDGKLDIITSNWRAGTVSVLLGNGDGTFQPAEQYAVGQDDGAVAVADLTGDGIPDIVTANYLDDTVSTLLGTGKGTFAPQVVYPVGSGPIGLVVTDLTGNGIPDIVTANTFGNDVSVLMGDGNGTFAPQRTFPAGAAPGSLAVADLNGDGTPDLVVNNTYYNTVSVLLGNGDGTFQPPRAHATGPGPDWVVVADLIGDGTPDLVAANSNGTISVLLGDGDGSFESQQVFSGDFPGEAIVGDLNGDGKPDIVVAGGGAVSVLLGNGDGTFQAPPPASAATALSLIPYAVTMADLTGDGRLDIITANVNDNSVSVLLQNRDGTFQTRQTFPTGAGTGPGALAVADLAGDGIADIVTADYHSNSVSVLMGNGDGTFQAPEIVAVGDSPNDVVVADLRRDGKEDIITANKTGNTISVLLGKGDGTFQPQAVYAVGTNPSAVVVAALTSNGIPDIVTSNHHNGTISVLLGNGNGTFQSAQTYTAGGSKGKAGAVVVADLAGNGIADIAVANSSSNTVSVLLGNGNGTFQSAVAYAVGDDPRGLAVADLTGDGVQDLISANYGDNTVSVLLGKGNGTFAKQQTFGTGVGDYGIAAADLNGDGKADIVTANESAGTVSVLLGNGDGTFKTQSTLQLGANKYSATLADVNGDGSLDLVETSRLQGTVSVQLGNGDGTFTQGATVVVGAQPTAASVADLNGDGRLDIVTTNSADNTVSVLLGNGNGTFQPQKTYAVGRSPRGLAIANLTGDGIPDLVVANYDDNTVSVLLGNGDGSFRTQEVFAVGSRPYAVTVAVLTGDGIPDIVVTNAGGDSVSVLMGKGNGSFLPQETFAVGRQPFAVAVADVTGDGIPDIVTANYADNTVSVLLGNGNGSFRTQQIFSTGDQPASVGVAGVAGGGLPDIVTADTGDNTISVLRNNGDGSFQAPFFVPSGQQQPIQALVADVNGDGLPDLLSVSNHDSAIGVLLNTGADTFRPATAAAAVGMTNTPFLVDLTGNGILDSVILDSSGDILFRAGLEGTSDSFAPPVILNPGRPARDIAIVNLGTGLAVAADDADFDPQASTNQFVFTVSIYTVSDAGNGSILAYGPPAPGGAAATASEGVKYSRSIAFSLTALPTSIIAADLTGNGLDDLITANALSNSVTISLQTAPGKFAAPVTVPVGNTPSDITVADLNGDLLPDIVVTDQASGDVTVLLNNLAHSFSQQLRLSAGAEPSTLSATSSGLSRSSVTLPVSAVAGDFLGNGQTDLVVVDRGAHSFTILAGDGYGSFLDPERSLTTSTSGGDNINNQPGAVVAGDFNRAGRLDLAVLMQDTGEVWVFTNEGNGKFNHTFTINVGDDATGLSVVPGNGLGLLNLLVGNSFGDVLILEGRGDGTFQIQGNRVSISVVPGLLGSGQAGVLVGDQQDDRVTVQAPSANGNQYTPVATLGSNSAGSQELAPGDVQWAYLDKGSPFPDAIVVGTGSNSVEVYRTISITDGAPTFAPSPQVYFVGTAPVSVTVADITDAGVPSLLVANQGSNDVSEIFGFFSAGGDWEGTLGPRLKSGGDGPIAVVVADLTGNSIPDLAVVNGGSGTVTMLPGVGGGFFNDQDPTVLFNLRNAVVQPPTFTGTSGVAYAVTAAGSLVKFDLDDPAAGASVAYSGQQVVAAQALASGQVVAALANGVVDLLVPQGSGLVVQSQLLADGAMPSLPSSIDVVTKANGLFDVLVSSEGSDNLSVFSLGGAIVPGGLTPSPGGATLPSLNNIQSPGASPGQLNLLSSSVIATSASATAASASTSASTSSSALSVTATSSVGLSLGGFSSLKSSSSNGNEEALLVAVEGNTYLSVPVLGFGAENDEVGNGIERMPWLAAEHPVGGASPLSRFLIGLDEALRNYRGTDDVASPRGSGHADDAWNEDLFFRHLPVHPQVVTPANESSTSGAGPQAMGPDPRQHDRPGQPQLAGEPIDEAGDPAFPADSWLVAGIKAVAGLIATALLAPTIYRFCGDASARK